MCYYLKNKNKTPVYRKWLRTVQAVLANINTWPQVICNCLPGHRHGWKTVVLPLTPMSRLLNP